MKILSEKDLVVTKWSGGETTQLAISPENATLQDRNFEWRISSAKVDLETSDFSDFSGYKRVIMPLDNDVVLTHDTPSGRLNVLLSAFEQNIFDGAWKTTSKGIMTDFNVIFKPHLCPKIQVNTLKVNESYTNSNHESIFFLYKGEVEIEGKAIHAKAIFFTHNILKFNILKESTLISVKFMDRN